MRRIEGLEREISRLSDHDHRFSTIDRELWRSCRLEKIDKDVTKAMENTNKLAIDMKNFSLDMAARIKQVELFSDNEV